MNFFNFFFYLLNLLFNLRNSIFGLNLNFIYLSFNLFLYFFLFFFNIFIFLSIFCLLLNFLLFDSKSTGFFFIIADGFLSVFNFFLFFFFLFLNLFFSNFFVLISWLFNLGVCWCWSLYYHSLSLISFEFLFFFLCFLLYFFCNRFTGNILTWFGFLFFFSHFRWLR